MEEQRWSFLTTFSLRAERGDDSPPALARLRCSYPAAASNRNLLCARREGERPLLRSQDRERAALDKEGLDLRLPHQRALHAEDGSATPGKPGRLRRLLQARKPAQTERDGAVSRFHLRRTGEAGQGQP